jgi:hypothetical protein
MNMTREVNENRRAMRRTMTMSAKSHDTFILSCKVQDFNVPLLILSYPLAIILLHISMYLWFDLVDKCR